MLFAAQQAATHAPLKAKQHPQTPEAAIKALQIRYFAEDWSAESIYSWTKVAQSLKAAFKAVARGKGIENHRDFARVVACRLEGFVFGAPGSRDIVAIFDRRKGIWFKKHAKAMRGIVADYLEEIFSYKRNCANAEDGERATEIIGVCSKLTSRGFITSVREEP